MGRLLDTLFPAGDGRKKKTSELIELGLQALRAARDARCVAAGAVTLVPSRLELRLSQGRYDELMEIGAVRDVEYYFNDELMRELSARGMRTFGDHPVFVTIAADPALQPNEIYGAVLSPMREEERAIPSASNDLYDRTGVLNDDGSVMAPPPARQGFLYMLQVRQSGGYNRLPLSGTKWILGRRGSSGGALPAGYVKVDLDLPATVSREQARVDLIGGDRLRIERLGKGTMCLASGEPIAQGESRLVPVGTPFFIDECEVTVMGERG